MDNKANAHFEKSFSSETARWLFRRTLLVEESKVHGHMSGDIRSTKTHSKNYGARRDKT